MNKIVSIVLLVGGVLLMILGVQATNSFNSDVSRFFTGSPTDKAIWMLIGGIILRRHRTGRHVAQLKDCLTW